MPKDKSRPPNPTTTQRKLDKQKALKKSKANLAAQRTARLAHRNPHRLEAQIAELVALRESRGGLGLTPRDARQLEELEGEVGRVRRAREVLGVGDGGGKGTGYAGLGKRGRGGGDGGGGGGDDDAGGDDSEETEEEVRRIPWPRDTPPAVPWRERSQQQQRGGGGTSANAEPLGPERFPARGAAADLSLPARPPPAGEATMVYQSEARVRDLRKEATSRFVPLAVKRKIDAKKGVGGRLLEEEEVRVLEGEGYGVLAKAVVGGEGEGDEARRLREEEEAFARELGVEGWVGIEEVSDEDL